MQLYYFNLYMSRTVVLQDLYRSASPRKCNVVSGELLSKPTALENPYIWTSICDANIQKYQFSNLTTC